MLRIVNYLDPQPALRPERPCCAGSVGCPTCRRPPLSRPGVADVVFAEGQWTVGPPLAVCTSVEAAIAALRLLYESRFPEVASLANDFAAQGDAMSEAPTWGELYDRLSEPERKKMFFFVLGILEFYACEDTWFATSIVSDPPCGDIVRDYRLAEDDRRRPGGRARLAMSWVVMAFRRRLHRHEEAGQDDGPRKD